MCVTSRFRDAERGRGRRVLLQGTTIMVRSAWTSTYSKLLRMKHWRIQTRVLCLVLTPSGRSG